MKIGRIRLSVGKQETNESGNTNASIKSSTSRKEWNSTTSDTIGLVVLITLLLSLSQSMRIEYGNRNEKDGSE